MLDLKKLLLQIDLVLAVIIIKRINILARIFFEGDNYRAAIERLDGGYEISMDIIEWMQDYCDNERAQIRNLISYADKWTSRLKQQSSLTSYHTTKRAQLDVVSITKKFAAVKEQTCTELDKVIEKYRNYVNEIYVSERLRPGRKHRRSNEIKKLLKTARASLRQVDDDLENLRNQQRKAREAVRAADSAVEILELDPTTSDKHHQRAIDVQTKKRTILSNIDEELIDMKRRHKIAQKTYRKKATEIFQQCQYLEEERLEQIRETLLDFIQAMYTQKYAMNVTELFDGLTKKITTQQNSFDDLIFWAKTYGIENKLTKSMTFTTSEDEDNSLKDEIHRTKKSTNLEDELSAVTNKSKVRRTKTTIIQDKKTIHADEPSTINNQPVLNQV